ncbi:MAG: 50S ribosomal protein L15 [Patescibacteria group bacterium]|jgi:large subunit ribosomal protein L15
MTELHQLSKTATKKSRVGRGISAGQGKTAGRGTKGQKSRSGYNIPRRFEGGQSSLMQRLPKIHGTKSHIQKPQVVSYIALERMFKDGAEITPTMLFESKLIKAANKRAKIIGVSSFTKKFKFDDGIILTKKLGLDLNKTS